MTSAIIISNDPIVVTETKNLLQGEIYINSLKIEDIESGHSDFHEIAIILIDIREDIATTLSDISKIRQSYALAFVLLAKDLTRDERLQALAAGVHHIFSGPPDREELILVLKNLARLMPIQSIGLRQDDPEGDWLLDETRWCVRTPLGHEVQLQRAEAAILAKLFMQPGINQSREDLAASFKSDREDKNRSLDVAISKIRKKVRDASKLGFPLRAIRGVGYVFMGSARLVSDVTAQRLQPTGEHLK